MWLNTTNGTCTHIISIWLPNIYSQNLQQWVSSLFFSSFRGHAVDFQIASNHKKKNSKEGCHGDTVVWPLQWTRWTVVLIMAVITTRASCCLGCREWSCGTKQVSALENGNNTQGMQEVLERVLFPLLLVWPTFFLVSSSDPPSQCNETPPDADYTVSVNQVWLRSRWASV